VVFARNRLFDWEVFASKTPTTPTIVVGNLNVGGTGKTPHTEYILKLLSQSERPALLSRGYGRKSQGYIRADSSSTSGQIGDEPLQILQKFPQIAVSVCEDRLSGIERLTIESKPNVIVLDDAFQHRRLKSKINILLMDYQHPWWQDFTLPAGNLRDNVYEKRRADIIIVTKCPIDLSESDAQKVRDRINPYANQSIYFTKISYSTPIQISGKKMNASDIRKSAGLAGIANPEPFELYLKEKFGLLKFRRFKDHYHFSQADIQELWTQCGKFVDPNFALLTTEKDAVKLRELDGFAEIPMYYVPVEIEFLWNEEHFKLNLKNKLHITVAQ
jgi:tetraacyldisaccharide 4'-kinase